MLTCSSDVRMPNVTEGVVDFKTWEISIIILLHNWRKNAQTLSNTISGEWISNAQKYSP